MNDAKAIKNICMVLPVTEEEVHQINHKLKTPHNWYDVATEIINDFNDPYIDDTNMDEEDY
jgi:hypothetical protein